MTRETTGLGILDGDQMLTVAQADGPNLAAMGDWTGRAAPLECHGSAHLLSLTNADGFVVVPMGVSELGAGATVECLLLPRYA